MQAMFPEDSVFALIFWSKFSVDFFLRLHKFTQAEAVGATFAKTNTWNVIFLIADRFRKGPNSCAKVIQVAYPALGDPRGPGHAFLLRSVLPLPKQIAPAFAKKSCSTISTSLQPFLSVDYIYLYIFINKYLLWLCF